MFITPDVVKQMFKELGIKAVVEDNPGIEISGVYGDKLVSYIKNGIVYIRTEKQSGNVYQIFLSFTNTYELQEVVRYEQDFERYMKAVNKEVGHRVDRRTKNGKCFKRSFAYWTDQYWNLRGLLGDKWSKEFGLDIEENKRLNEEVKKLFERHKNEKG